MCCVLTMVEVNQLLFVESFAGVILKYNFGHAHNYRYVYMKILSALDLSIVNTTQNSYIQNIRQIISFSFCNKGLFLLFHSQQAAKEAKVSFIWCPKHFYVIIFLDHAVF